VCIEQCRQQLPRVLAPEQRAAAAGRIGFVAARLKRLTAALTPRRPTPGPAPAGSPAHTSLDRAATPSAEGPRLERPASSPGCGPGTPGAPRPRGEASPEQAPTVDVKAVRFELRGAPRTPARGFAAAAATPVRPARTPLRTPASAPAGAGRGAEALLGEGGARGCASAGKAHALARAPRPESAPAGGQDLGVERLVPWPGVRAEVALRALWGELVRQVGGEEHQEAGSVRGVEAPAWSVPAGAHSALRHSPPHASPASAARVGPDRAVRRALFAARPAPLRSPPCCLLRPMVPHGRAPRRATPSQPA